MRPGQQESDGPDECSGHAPKVGLRRPLRQAKEARLQVLRFRLQGLHWPPPTIGPWAVSSCCMLRPFTVCLMTVIPFDGVVEKTKPMTERPVGRGYVDNGYRGHEVANPRQVFCSGQRRGRCTARSNVSCGGARPK